MNLLVNFGIVLGPFLLSILYPNVGLLAGMLGSFTVFGIIYLLPTMTYMKVKYIQAKGVPSSKPDEEDYPDLLSSRIDSRRPSLQSHFMIGKDINESPLN